MTRNKKMAILFTALGTTLAVCAVAFFVRGNVVMGACDTVLALTDFGWAYLYTKEG